MTKQKVKWFFLGIIFLSIVGLLIWLGYQKEWTGFNYRPEYSGYEPGKFLWDWLEVLIIPVLLAFLGYYFTIRQKKHENELAKNESLLKKAEADQRAQEKSLRQYFERINDLLLHDGLADNHPNETVKSTARSATLEVFRVIDNKRAVTVINYLYENDLITGEVPRVDLSNLRFDKIDLAKRDFRNINLSGIRFYSGNFQQTDFSDSHLQRTIFWDCNLQGSKFKRAVLKNADLKSSKLIRADFSDSTCVRADFSYTSMFETLFVNANLEYSEYFQAEMIQTVFKGANLSFAMFVQSIIWDVFLGEADLTGANTNSAYITGSPPLETNWMPPETTPISPSKKSILKGIPKKPKRRERRDSKYF